MKKRMIVAFLVFLLAIIASSIFIYKVSKNTRDSSQQPEKQVEKAEIPLQVLSERRVRGSDWESIKTKGFVDKIENKRVIFPLKVKKFLDHDHGGNYRPKWERAGREYVAYTIETKPIKVDWEKRVLIITDLAIVWKDKNNEISDIDSIFHEGAEIEIKLSADLGKGLNLGKNWLLRENWRWRVDGRNTFALEVFSDYEIITPTRKVKFY